MKEKRFDTSQKKMFKGLIALLNQKDFLDISVKELCIVSDINRSTFYSHYQNTYELLEDLKEDMIATFLDSFSDEKENFNSGNYEENYIKKEFLIPFLNLVKENRIIYETFIKLHLTFSSDELFNKLITYVSIPVSKKYHSNTKESSLIYISKFIVQGTTALINLWIKRGFKESPEEICSLILKCINGFFNN